MKSHYQHLLKPEILHSLKGLELASKVIVDSFLAGLNKSSRVGSGMEFSQYRSYEPGDDLRLLDWKMLARSERYYIKQADLETNITVKFIIDASKSMLEQPDELVKMDYTRVAVASLAFLAQHQGDAIGLFALNDQDFYNLYPRISKRHFNRFLQYLLDIKNEGKWPTNPVETEKLHDRRHKELIIVFTDMYEYEHELSDFLFRLKTKRNEVVVFHVISEKERLLQYKGPITFESLETGERKKVDVNTVRRDYINTFSDRIDALRSAMLENGIDYQLFNVDNDVKQVLQSFLKKRNALL
ncbi:MAG: DUF58 domain-containing protein [Fulvivirga sp.]|nr:DUF58 domain-containing protein [Fulvivirga sp.]